MGIIHQCWADSVKSVTSHDFLTQSAATVIHTEGGGGWLEAKQKVRAPETDLQCRVPLMNCFFFLRKNFLMWVGGWVGGWVGRRSPGCPPPPPPGNGKLWPGDLLLVGGLVVVGVVELLVTIPSFRTLNLLHLQLILSPLHSTDRQTRHKSRSDNCEVVDRLLVQ